jgi:hypothetical protein
MTAAELIALLKSHPKACGRLGIDYEDSEDEFGREYRCFVWRSLGRHMVLYTDREESGRRFEQFRDALASEMVRSGHPSLPALLAAIEAAEETTT